MADASSEIARLKEQIHQEKAGKRKLFHSLVKLANELRREKDLSNTLLEEASYVNRNWYEGGLWRSPEVLPAVGQQQQQQSQTTSGSIDEKQQQIRRMTRISAISLSDLFFSLVVVTAFTRIGVAISQQGRIDENTLVYFAVFWTVWYKETAYSSRFDTSDLSAQVETLITCFAILFASLSVQAPMNSEDGTRIMIMAAEIAILHLLLHLRVLWTIWEEAKMGTSSANGSQSNGGGDAQSALARHVRAYALFNVLMNLAEAIVWVVGIVYYPMGWEYRWAVFVGGVVLALRVPKAFLSDDFHAACSKRGVLFILLLGFLLQSIVVVASEFFAYQTPSITDYSFIGSACLLLFCIKLLYVDDSDTLAEDHALLINRWAGFFFNLGQFCLLLSTTVLGSGLNLLTHSYLAATAALPGPAKNLVCGGLSMVLVSALFIKSMHLKRVPIDPHNRSLFMMAYSVQTIVLLAVSITTGIMCLGKNLGGMLEYLMNSDIQLLFALSGATLFVVMMSWMDEAIELTIYNSAEDARAFRTYTFGFWWCLHPTVAPDVDIEAAQQIGRQSTRLSVLSPLLGESVANMARSEWAGYESLGTSQTTY